ncbi:MarR family transcriptional regulator [Halomicrobium mukohataei]|uniref:MarR family transcriptional regulator n=1 Tax=Halomicrobium mukohataei TaxID=57705 RepID=A0A847U8X1_9EURY|nr:MarR family transcriptional regulator [Halomicrobium mukohataei]NLV08717.1 MarR family transcriptional regulator [Halomicrobium mukohataei]
MRYSGDWMVLADDRILEYIREKDSGRPKEMEDSGYVRYTRSYISQRCKKLVNHGLLRDLGNGVYTITERGKRYLDGEIDTSEGTPDEVESVFNENDGPSAGENHEQV